MKNVLILHLIAIVVLASIGLHEAQQQQRAESVGDHILSLIFGASDEGICFIQDDDFCSDNVPTRQCSATCVPRELVPGYDCVPANPPMEYPPLEDPPATIKLSVQREIYSREIAQCAKVTPQHLHSQRDEDISGGRVACQVVYECTCEELVLGSGIHDCVRSEDNNGNGIIFSESEDHRVECKPDGDYCAFDEL